MAFKSTSTFSAVAQAPAAAGRLQAAFPMTPGANATKIQSAKPREMSQELIRG
ncbi:MAG: hypothetical protein IH605_14705 [Burkholderiales bacterium]|nr:hypothetical protein [Burkholderiales bacterium]